jgi:hypothetical protein
MIPRRVWLAAAVAAVGIGAVTLVASVLNAGDGGRGLPNGKPISATATIEPTTPLFADQITARIDVAVDRKRADPGKLHVKASFVPFERVAHKTTRRDAGRITFIRETWTLRCLVRRCAQVQPTFAAGIAGAKGSGRRATTPPPAQISYDGGGVEPLQLEWPTVEWLTRINRTEESSPNYFYHVDLAPPTASYAISPGRLLGVLSAALLVLLAVPASLVLRRILERRRAHAPESKDELPPLERALRLLEWANDRPVGDDRRRALELVAVELVRSGRPDLGAKARELAWQPPSPASEEAGRLGARVRTTMGGNGASPE